MDIRRPHAPSIGEGFSQGIAPTLRPSFKDPMAPEFFGSQPPLWMTYAWDGKDGYVCEGSGNVVMLSELAKRREAYYLSMGVAEEDLVVGVGLKDDGIEMAAVGGKGSGKSFSFGMKYIQYIQRHPGIKLGLAANSYSQAFGSGAEKLVKVANGMGIDFFHRGEMMIDGVKHYEVYVFPEFDARVCILSFERMNLIEGTEWDGMWFEEIQDCKQGPVVKAMSRCRRGQAPPIQLFAGMPDDEGHWMYGFFENSGIALFEPAVKENEMNIPPEYIPNLYRQYSGTDVDRYILGKRVSLNRIRGIQSFSYPIHVRRKDLLTERLCNYDPSLPIYISIDFNVFPMCAIGVQVKDWVFEDARGARPKKIACQVFEWELFNANTASMCEKMLADVSGHRMGGVVTGDATGGVRDTRSPGVTDWTIIQEAFSGLPGMVIQPGVVRVRNDRATRERRILEYRNPIKKDAITSLNGCLIDSDGDPGWLFLPESDFDSGGAARSVSRYRLTATSRVDDSNDKDTVDRSLARTHFTDTVLYLNWFLNEGVKSRPGNRSKLNMSRSQMRAAAGVNVVDGGTISRPTLRDNSATKSTKSPFESVGAEAARNYRRSMIGR